ncbi:cache domain-containing protein [Pelomonas sp. SE-A7]|uniref:cache domain-containing protein n=1 Tax=Pelomonas sp. SE-A7 TaxID=3054953 RepID=UPI00259C6F63|nr:cache domain-containing protein [Pelomonas sp. SE-A7]MDM4765707.1 cache domain-containing protein [Pelomonas sp. SE-A7]
MTGFFFAGAAGCKALTAARIAGFPVFVVDADPPAGPARMQSSNQGIQDRRSPVNGRRRAWLLGLCLMPCGVLAESRATPEEAVALVRQGVAFYQANGRVKALAAFNDPKGPFVKGELYFFVYGANGDGVALAHGQNPKMVGKKLLDMRDANGRFLIRDANRVAASPDGRGWIRYMWPNRLTKRVEPKLSYIERVGDIWIGCGVLDSGAGASSPQR